MKRFFAFAALACVLTAALALCACSAQPSFDTDADANADAAPSTASSSASASQPAQPPAAPLRTLDTYLWGSANSTGFYSHTSPLNGLDAGYCLNFATGTQTLLCTVSGCDHTQDICGAALNPTAEIHDGTLLADEDKLYWVSGTGGHTALTGGVTRPYVEVSDLDGANRRVLFTLPEGTFLQEAPIVTSDTTMYLNLMHSSTDRTVHDTRLLVGVDIQTGEIGLQYELTGLFPRFLGAYDGKLLFEETTLTPDCPEQPRYEYYNMLANRETLLPYMRTGLFTLTTDSAQRTELYTVNGPMPGGTYKDGSVYTVDTQARTLSQTKLADGKAVVLAQNLPQGASIDSVWHDYVLLYTADNPESLYGQTLHLVHKATGEVRTSPLRRMHKMEPSYPTVLHETNDDFFVVSDATFVKKTLLGPDASTYTVDSERLTYALINKQAFFEGRPEYRVIALLPELQDWMN